ncbi:MAG: alanine racemase [Balneolaceae bacterium]|nr:alanine racemase [Balneolaceae bacterium]
MTRKFSGNSFIEVDLSVLRENISVLNKFLADGVRQMAVVKSDAYGHGAVEISKAIEDQVAWLAVNDVDEGIELREAGIELPILVFGVPRERSAPVYVSRDLTATVSRPEQIKKLQPGTEFHLNFDTGMGRLGLFKEEIPVIKEAISNHGQVACTGIYSHFATAEDPGSNKAAAQLEKFKEIRSNFDPNLLTHMANTGGTAFYPGSHFDMVRVGIGMYGYAPGATPVEGLKPCILWRSHLSQIRRIRKGDTVSYGARWEAPQDGFVGTIPVGYEEGVPRIISGNLKVCINGDLYPVVGTVTMNYIMVYLGLDHQNLEIGHPVDILGGAALAADEWARRTGTIPYEIVTGLSRRLPRFYTVN